MVAGQRHVWRRVRVSIRDPCWFLHDVRLSACEPPNSANQRRHAHPSAERLYALVSATERIVRGAATCCAASRSWRSSAAMNAARAVRSGVLRACCMPGGRYDGTLRLGSPGYVINGSALCFRLCAIVLRHR
jgi:hypothetical protein